MLLSSILGMVVMASARDLITIFVALELLSIPAHMLATWRKRDLKSNEAGLKYYLMGVFASAIMLYGMSLIFGVSGSTILVDINAAISSGESSTSIITLVVIFVFIGFAAWLLLLPLAITSSQKMVFLLKNKWKKLHRLIYVIAIFGSLHYIWLSKTIFFRPLVYLIIILVLLALRIKIKNRNINYG